MYTYICIAASMYTMYISGHFTNAGVIIYSLIEISTPLICLCVYICYSSAARVNKFAGLRSSTYICFLEKMIDGEAAIGSERDIRIPCFFIGLYQVGCRCWLFDCVRFFGRLNVFQQRMRGDTCIL